jgi:L-ascorbate metabolism protein UlaG (beta-lactamase superfamily)
MMFSGPRHRGPVTDHFDGSRFRNQIDAHPRPPLAVAKWLLARKPGPWPKWVDAPLGPPPPERVGAGELRVTFVGHATVLVQLEGLNVLTDPVWSERVSPLRFAGPRRRRPPGLRLEDLPPIDLVLVSHNHYDHLDLATLRTLSKAHAPRILTGLGNELLLRKKRIPRGEALDWWSETEVGPGVRVVGVPARHFSNRGIVDQDATLWMGFALVGPAGVVYFAGDTGFGPHFQQIRDRLGPPRLALLPIGAFLPQWFMSPVHVSPEEALEAHRVLGARTSVAIHWGTFPLADDAMHDPPERLARAAAGTPDSERFWVLGHGEGRDVPAHDAEARAASVR